MKPRTPLEAKLRLISPSRAASCHGTYCAPQGPPVLGDYSLTGIPPVYLDDLLRLTGDHSEPYGDSETTVQVLRPSSTRYYRLSDYVVSSAVSGPSIILMQRF